jgi:hypothetical protein
MKRTLSALMALIMLLGIVCTAIGCSDPVGGEETVTTTEAAVAESNIEEVTTDSLYDSNGYLKDDLDPTLNFGDETVNIFAWEHTLPEFYVEEQSGNIVEDAVYTRNANTESRLGVKLEFTFAKGNSTAFKDFCNTLANSISVGEGAYDLIGCYLRSAGVLTLEHYLVDLLEVEHLDFEKPWWSDSLLELNTINNRLYFTSGDIASTLIYQMMFIVYNNDLGNQLNLTNPQALAIDGKWTQELLIEMSEGVYSDLDNDGAKSLNDRYGLFSITHPLLDIFYMGAGLNYVIPSSDGVLAISDDVLSDKSFAIIDRFNDLYHKSNDGFFIKTASATLYADGNSLFYNVTGQHLAQQFRNSEINYSILPAPKFDETQENYRTPVAFTHTMYCIPIDAKNTEKSGAVLECMASEAYRTVTPALFETAFKYQYSKNPYDAELFEVIRDNVVFDIGRPFFDSLGGDQSSPIRVWRMQIENGNNTLSSSAKVQLRAWNKSLTKLTEELKADN